MGKQQKQLLSKEVLDQITEHAAKVAWKPTTSRRTGGEGEVRQEAQ